MKARVKDSYRFDVVQAHTGREYIKGEWRFVPEGDEQIELLEYQTGELKPKTTVTKRKKAAK